MIFFKRKIKDAFQNGFEKGYKECLNDREAEKIRAYKSGYEAAIRDIKTKILKGDNDESITC